VLLTSRCAFCLCSHTAGRPSCALCAPLSVVWLLRYSLPPHLAQRVLPPRLEGESQCPSQPPCVTWLQHCCTAAPLCHLAPALLYRSPGMCPCAVCTLSGQYSLASIKHCGAQCTHMHPKLFTISHTSPAWQQHLGSTHPLLPLLPRRALWVPPADKLVRMAWHAKPTTCP
jgi:hypothetical protein